MVEYLVGGLRNLERFAAREELPTVVYETLRASEMVFNPSERTDERKAIGMPLSDVYDSVGSLDCGAHYVFGREHDIFGNGFVAWILLGYRNRSTRLFLINRLQRHGYYGESERCRE